MPATISRVFMNGNVALNLARNDFRVAMVALRKFDQTGNQHRLALH